MNCRPNFTFTDNDSLKYLAKEKGIHNNPVYAAMVESVDQTAGKIMKALDKTGVSGQTLVIFTSDNGGNIHCTIGKMSFSEADLLENLLFFHDTIVKIKPAAAKGQYIKKMVVSGTTSSMITGSCACWASWSVLQTAPTAA